MVKLHVVELSQGDRKAFGKLFDLYWNTMFFNALHIVGDESVAKDIVQEIWVKLWQNRETAKIENFEAYMNRAVKNSCYKYFRDTKFSKMQMDIIGELPLIVKSEVNKQHDLDEALVHIKKGLRRLPKRCAQIFELSRFKQYSNEEIASELGISKRSVENQISLAIKSLKHTIAIVCLLLLLR